MPVVLHCIPGLRGGGAERQLACLAGPLAACGWRVHVAYAQDGPNRVRAEAGGAVLHKIEIAGNYDPRLLSQLRRVFDRVKPDMVQLWLAQMQIAGGAIARLRHVPWVLAERSSALAYPPTAKNRLRILMARRAAAIVANSPGGVEYWRRRARVAVHLVPNAVPLDEIDAAFPAMPAGLEPDAPRGAVVIAAARFDREKNVDTLVAAMREVVRLSDTTVILCGDGVERPRIERELAADGLSQRILTPGYVDPIWPAMKMARVAVSASQFEGHPNAALEAIASGTPVALSDIPAHRDVVDRSAAWWFDPVDPGAIAAAVRAALARPEESRRRAAAARQVARRWTLAMAAAEYSRIYVEAIDARVNGRAARQSVADFGATIRPRDPNRG
jgi:glycosyltransferase involved in cell wall biosynthesis